MNVFSLAFLAAITCGFGAIILFYMIIVANIDLRHDLVVEDVSGDVDRIEMRVMAGRKNLVQLQQELATLIEEQAVLRGLRSSLSSEIDDTRQQFSSLTETTLARRQTVEELEAELEELRAEIERASAESVTPEEAGDRIRSVTGEGNRQYLTGLRMGGERVVILIDASTSMLDRTLVNVI